jgi:hypothetical protein
MAHARIVVGNLEARGDFRWNRIRLSRGKLVQDLRIAGCRLRWKAAMIIKQKGGWVTLYRVAGTVFLLLAVLYVALWLAQFAGDWGLAPGGLGGRHLGLLAYAALFGGLGIQFRSQFPDIHLTDQGLETRALFLRSRFAWPQVAGLVERPGRARTRAILIHRQRTLLHRLFGLAENVQEPAILISPKAENLPALEAAVRQHASGGAVSRPG